MRTPGTGVGLILGTVGSASVQAATDLAQQAIKAANAASAKAQNAQDMILTRDTALADIDLEVDGFAELVQAAETDHAAIRKAALDGDDALRASLQASIDAITLTPGPPGTPGSDGADGAAGADAPAPQFAVGPIATLPPGASATVEVAGVYPNLTLSFGLPAGAKGDRGDDGSDSQVPGPPGKDGSAGPAGKDAAVPVLRIGTVSTAASPSAALTVTPTAWVLDLVLPTPLQGLKGDKGDAGPKGDKGDTGTGGVAQIEYRDGVAIPAVLSLLGLSATVEVAVTWPTPFPSAAYTILKPQVTPTAASLIGRVDAVVKPNSVTAAGCTVVVTVTAVLAAGAATLAVLAYRKA